MSGELFIYKDYFGRTFKIYQDGVSLPFIDHVKWNNVTGMSYHPKGRLSLTLKQCSKPKFLKNLFSFGVSFKNTSSGLVVTYSPLPRKELVKFFSVMHKTNSSSSKDTKQIIRDSMWKIANPE